MPADKTENWEKENEKFEEYQKFKKEIASMWKKRTLWFLVGSLQGVAKNLEKLGTRTRVH